MTDWNAVSAFMANVVAWPGPQDPGFINLHYSMPNIREPAKGLLKGMGWPFRSVDDLVNRAAWMNTVPDKFKDAWFCTSTQSSSRTNSKGKPKAVRLAANAIKLKAIWIDIDVGPPEPGKKPKYPDIPTALKAALLFIKTVGLPSPSSIVYSGGGIHVYWISKSPLDPAVWLPYASGLKQLLLANNILCDTGLTTDSARILRVPGTFNYKYDPPKPVTLAPLPLVMYDFAQLDFLKQFAAPTPAAPAAGHQLFADGVTAETFGKPNPAFAALKNEPDLNAGIDKNSDQLLDPFPIFRQCGFLRDALTTGGKDYDQTLWMYSVLCSTFMENGNDIAHKVSSGHASYSKADTQALYDRKMAERADRGIGYPSCATIAGAGCEACKTCPLFTKGKSPLNIRPAPAVTATVTPAVQSAGAAATHLPNTFELNNEGVICKLLETDNDGELTTQLVPLFQCQLSNFWLQKHPGEHVNFTATMDKGFAEPVSISMGEISKQGFAAYLGDKRVLIDVRGEKFLKEFFLSIIGKLRSLAAAQETVPFGWVEQGGKVAGFAYGGTVFLDDGTEKPAGVADATLVKYYTPTGNLTDWLAAAKTVTDRKRPELTTIMLMAFASPLLYLNGKNCAVLSAYGKDSGAGKSSASRVGMSVWGHPLASKITERQTANSVAGIMRTLRHLPFYWDEITNDEMRKKFKMMMHELDGGKEKGRMKSGSEHQEIGMFQLMLHYLANGSLVSFLRKDNINTVASQMRVLEWEVKRIKDAPGDMQDADAEMLLANTNRNYGHMGLLYSKFLALNHVAIAEEFRLKCNEVQNKTGGKTSERYWYTTVAVMTLAAKYAKALGMDVDPDEIEAFMYKVYTENINARELYAQGGDLDNSEDVLTRYLGARDSAERGVWTNYMNIGAGRPSTKPVQVLKGPTTPRNLQGKVEFRFAIENRVLAIALKDFSSYLEEFKHADTQIFASLMEQYKTTRQKLALMGGTVHNTGREWCLILNVTPDTPLWPFMVNMVAPEERKKMEEGEPIEPEVVDTGITGIEIDSNGLATAASVKAFVMGAKVA